MSRNERLHKIYLKWFKLGFEEHLKCLYHPGRWMGANKAYDVDYQYNITFIESLPWNNKWTWRGYRDGYYFVDPFNYANKMPNNSSIREFFDWRVNPNGN